MGSLVRRLAAQVMSDYAPPPAIHAEELLQALEASASGGGTEGEWANLAAEIVAALRQGGVNRFLRLPPIRRTVHPPMRKLGQRYWSYLLRSGRFSASIHQALTESPVGEPLLSPHYPLTSPLLMQHGYHLVRLLESTDFDLSRLAFAAEFGGGYGSFFRLLRNLGYRGRYAICDLPVMCALQRFYLRNVFPTGERGAPPSNLEWLSGGLCEALMRRTAEHAPSLFVATWSLSESPLAIRDEVAPALAGFDYILCAYQRTFGGIDNVGYFSALERSLPQFAWRHAECPAYRNNFYLIGRRSS
jgi:hypothetical protein